MPKRISITLLLTVLMGVLALCAATAAWAQVYQCPEGVTCYQCPEIPDCTYSQPLDGSSWECNGTRLESVSVEPVQCSDDPGSICPCADNPTGSCGVATYNSISTAPPVASHFNFLSPRIGEVAGCDNCDAAWLCGKPDPSTEDCAWPYLTENCILKVTPHGSDVIQTFSVALKGKFDVGILDVVAKGNADFTTMAHGAINGLVPSCGEGETYATTQDIKKVIQEHDGKEYEICLKQVKINSNCYTEAYYACVPTSGKCKDVGKFGNDDDWCQFYRQPHDPKFVSQIYGDPSCDNFAHIPNHSAFVLCGGDESPLPDTLKYPLCLPSNLVTLSYNGGFANPCTPATPPPPTGYGGCIELSNGGYPDCICW